MRVRARERADVCVRLCVRARVPFPPAPELSGRRTWRLVQGGRGGAVDLHICLSVAPYGDSCVCVLLHARCINLDAHTTPPYLPLRYLRR